MWIRDVDKAGSPESKIRGNQCHHSSTQESHVFLIQAYLLTSTGVKDVTLGTVITFGIVITIVNMFPFGIVTSCCNVVLTFPKLVNKKTLPQDNSDGHSIVLKCLEPLWCDPSAGKACNHCSRLQRYGSLCYSSFKRQWC